MADLMSNGLHAIPPKRYDPAPMTQTPPGTETVLPDGSVAPRPPAQSTQPKPAPMQNGLGNPFMIKREPKYEGVGAALSGFQRVIDPEAFQQRRADAEAKGAEQMQSMLAMMQHQRQMPAEQRVAYAQQVGPQLAQQFGMDLPPNAFDPSNFTDEALDMQISGLMAQMGQGPVPEETLTPYQQAQLEQEELDRQYQMERDALTDARYEQEYADQRGDAAFDRRRLSQTDQRYSFINPGNGTVVRANPNTGEYETIVSGPSGGRSQPGYGGVPQTYGQGGFQRVSNGGGTVRDYMQNQRGGGNPFLEDTPLGPKFIGDPQIIRIQAQSEGLELDPKAPDFDPLAIYPPPAYNPLDLTTPGARGSLMNNEQKKIDEALAAANRAKTLAADSNRFMSLIEYDEGDPSRPDSFADALGQGPDAWVKRRLSMRTSGLDAITNKLAPAQREPGSGHMSDKDVEMFRRAVHSVNNTYETNQHMNEIFSAMGRRADQYATFVQRYMNAHGPGSFSSAQSLWNEFTRANPLYDDRGFASDVYLSDTAMVTPEEWLAAFRFGDEWGPVIGDKPAKDDDNVDDLFGKYGIE